MSPFRFHFASDGWLLAEVVQRAAVRRGGSAALKMGRLLRLSPVWVTYRVVFS